MKRIAIFVLTALIGGLVSAGQFTWTAANLDSRFSTGTGYLLEVPTASAPTIQEIKDYLLTNGVTAPAETNVTLVGSGTVIDDYGQWSIVNATQMTSGSIAGNSYFVLVFDETQSAFVISQIVEGNPGPLGEQVEIFGDYYSDDPATYWGDPISLEIIPEPTVLALLALGVAGVALRRKM